MLNKNPSASNDMLFHPDTLTQLKRLIGQHHCVQLTNTRLAYSHAFKKPFAQPLIQINHPLFKANLLLNGAQLITFTPKEDTEWLWLSPFSDFSPQRAVRGGIPLCFPWFGRHPDNQQQPKHGIARISPWQLASLDSNAQAVEISFTLDPLVQSQTSGYPPFKVELIYNLSKTIRIDLRFSPTQYCSLPISYAFHTYFAIEDITKTSVTGLENNPFFNSAEQKTEPARLQPLTFNHEVDLVFNQVQSTQQVIANKACFLISSNTPSCIVWNPGAQLAHNINDIKSHYKHYVCLERGAVTADQIPLSPSQLHTASMEISKM